MESFKCNGKVKLDYTAGYIEYINTKHEDVFLLLFIKEILFVFTAVQFLFIYVTIPVFIYATVYCWGKHRSSQFSLDKPNFKHY